MLLLDFFSSLFNFKSTVLQKLDTIEGEILTLRQENQQLRNRLLLEQAVMESVFPDFQSTQRRNKSLLRRLK